MEAIASTSREPWNKVKLVNQKTPFKLKEIWTIQVRLQIANRCRELALFNLAVDSKLRACDLLQLRVRDVYHGQTIASRALVLQQKSRRPAVGICQMRIKGFRHTVALFNSSRPSRKRDDASSQMCDGAAMMGLQQTSSVFVTTRALDENKSGYACHKITARNA